MSEVDSLNNKIETSFQAECLKMFSDSTTPEIAEFLFGKDIMEGVCDKHLLNLVHALHFHRFSNSGGLSIRASIAVDELLARLENNADSEVTDIKELFTSCINNITTGESIHLLREIDKKGIDGNMAIAVLRKCILNNELVSMTLEK